MRFVIAQACAVTAVVADRTLADWLAYQETLHPQAIALGLERVHAVHAVLGGQRPAPVVITVAGTNGKGSCVAFLEAVYRAAGYRVGAYTSPHLFTYNERVRLSGAAVSDAVLCRAFERIEAARGATPLTYFEFGTLAALTIFAAESLDVAILEVGLGGRLDAVNIVDADVALVTSIGIDHVDWLGPDRESIAREKAGILRAGRPVVCGDADPPASLRVIAAELGTPWYGLNQEFGYSESRDGLQWYAPRRCIELPYPQLPGAHQYANAASVAMVVELLQGRLAVPQQALINGIAGAHVPGRFQIVPGAVEHIYDVAHNPHAATALAAALRQRPCAGRTHAVLALLIDKDAPGIAAALKGAVDRWYLAGLPGNRGQNAEALAVRLGGVILPHARCNTVDTALECARSDAKPGDRIVVFGSFHTVAETLTL